MNSRPLLATDKTKLTLNWFEYWIGHCWMTGWQSIRGAYRIWADLMTSNYKDYTLMWYEDPYEECYSWFWTSLGEDNTLPKEFLEHLMQLAEDVMTGKEKAIPFDNLDDLDDLIENIKGDENDI